MDKIKWDGVTRLYVPPLDWKKRIHPSVQLHTDAVPEEELDPVTYEVLRHSLWLINEEHGTTISRLSGSPTINIVMDLNPVMLTEDCEYISYGPYVLYLTAGADNGIKWIYENLSENPGIYEDDVFLGNDPWIVAIHQVDAVLMAPVFWEGKVFCWVGNSAHQYDIGGSMPGSWCTDARDVFDDPISWPPTKIVEKGVLRKDLEKVWLRQSRMPDLVALDFHAELAGIEVAKRRIKQLIQQYGAPVVKAVMRKVINDSEKAFVEKMRRLPDGEWYDECYYELKEAGDRHLYKGCVKMTKKGTELVFENAGTDPPSGTVGMSGLLFKGAIEAGLTVVFCWDQLFAIGGALRHIDFKFTPNTITCVDWPTAVSAGVMHAPPNCNLCISLLGALISCDPELKKEALSVGSTWPMLIAFGKDQHGRPFGTGFMEPIFAGSPASSFRDGVDTGGFAWIPKGIGPNIERHETDFPVLYVYRRELQNSGGAGKYRGGVGGEFAIIAHKTNVVYYNTMTGGAGTTLPASGGVFGGYPGGQCSYLIRKNTNVRELMKKGRMARDVSELEGESIEAMPLKQPHNKATAQGEHDVVVFRWGASGGYGDPLERDPQAVAKDVLNGYVSARAAKELYGVVVDQDTFQVDEPATKKARQNILSERRRFSK